MESLERKITPQHLNREHFEAIEQSYSSEELRGSGPVQPESSLASLEAFLLAKIGEYVKASLGI